jgi:subtilisin family serine protease
MNPLELVKLTPLMQHSSGRPEITIGLVDGPVAMDHPDLVGQNIRQVNQESPGACSRASSMACMHGTFVAGILSAKRSSNAPAICPNCTLLVRPIFPEAASANEDTPSAKPEELAAAIIDTVDAGARVINLSAALAQSSAAGERTLEEALNYAARRSVIVVAAAGNQALVGSSAITRHPWVVPVAGCDEQGRLMAESNIGKSIGRNGLMAPATQIASLGTDGKPQISAGTSAAVPFVTGTIALLWSEFSNASVAQIRAGLNLGWERTRRSIGPPLLNAWESYQVLSAN